MTTQQLQQAYFQRIRQQQIYRALMAAYSEEKTNSYDVIKEIDGSKGFLNYIEYSPVKIDSQKAADYLKSLESDFLAGRCTGVYSKDSGKVLRQLDWYYNNEVEFIIKMKSDPVKGVYGSIGVTAASPKLTKEIAKHYISTGEYYEYFDFIPFFTVDGVNENGIFAQSNVVNKHGIDIDINKNDPTKIDCCIPMVVRYILDKFSQDDMINSNAVRDKLNKLHIFGTSKLGGYNSHVLVVCQKLKKSYVVEFTSNQILVNEFPIITNFRTVNSSLSAISLDENYMVNWNEVEQDGIGIERWEICAKLLKRKSGNYSEFRQLRNQLNYAHAYDRPFVQNKTWLTDNLSGDLTITDAKTCHENGISQKFQDVLDGYKEQFNNRSRDTGKTWITTHSSIYDLINLSCNIRSQLSTDEESSWNVTFDGKISEDKEYDGLCFTAEYPNSTIKLQNVNGTYQTSIDGQNWTDYELGKVITLSKVGDKVYFAAKTVNDTCWEGHENNKFVMTGEIAASGNIQSLLDKTCQRTDVPTCCYMHIFGNCTSLTKPPSLPAITLNEKCYYTMFLNCTALTVAPQLPATNLVKECYKFMFLGCSSLTAVPELSAKTLAPYCCDTMFGNCISLTTAPTLSSEVLYDYCYANMFNGCISLKISENGSVGSVVLYLKEGTTEADEWNTNMFEGTIRDFEGNPMIGKTYRCY